MFDITKKRLLGVAPPFYVLLFMIVIISLGYMMLLGVPTNNLGLISVSLIFGFLFLSGLIISKSKLSALDEPFSVSAKGWLLGMIAWTAATNLKYISSYFDIFSFPVQATLSTIEMQIPQFWNFINIVFMAPITEEIFWGLALPFTVFALMDEMGKEFNFMKNPILQFLIVISLGAGTFAAFHTSATQYGFFIAAMFFRTIQTAIFYGDAKYNIIPKYVVPYSFLVGTHMANNLAVFGIVNAYNILITNTFGIIILVVFAFITASAIRSFLDF